MAFSSVQFLFIFLPLSLAVYWLLPKALRNGALGAFSLLFFAWAGLKGAAILLALAAITWLGGLLLEKLPRKKPLLILLIAAHLAVLAAFKYAGFAARSINALVPDLLPVFAPALPLGISFYVFTAIGYLADVSCGKVAAARSPFRFFVFLAFFGHGPSGPIVRYDQQLPCLDAKAAERQVSLDRFCYGIKRFVLGLAKKAIIADQLALIYSRVTSVPAATVPAPALVLGYLAYMMQLYFDFSGYSDMAIGIGSFFGLELPENFNYPYLSCSVGEYWRRWHMSLSGWFRDYVYIPLGGNRCSRARHLLNLLVVWMLTGLWHGSAWNFVLWGLYYAVLLIGEKFLWGKAIQKLPGLVQHVYALVLIIVGWVLFRSGSLAQVGEMVSAMFGAAPGGVWSGESVYYLRQYAWEWAVAVIAAMPVKNWLSARLEARRAAGSAAAAATLAWGVKLLAFILLGWSVVRILSTGVQSFLYFQF